MHGKLSAYEALMQVVRYGIYPISANNSTSQLVLAPVNARFVVLATSQKH